MDSLFTVSKIDWQWPLSIFKASKITNKVFSPNQFNFLKDFFNRHRYNQLLGVNSYCVISPSRIYFLRSDCGRLILPSHPELKYQIIFRLDDEIFTSNDSGINLSNYCRSQVGNRAFFDIREPLLATIIKIEKHQILLISDIFLKAPF